MHLRLPSPVLAGKCACVTRPFCPYQGLVCPALSPKQLPDNASHLLRHGRVRAINNAGWQQSPAGCTAKATGAAAGGVRTCQYFWAHRSMQLFSPTLSSPSLYLHADENALYASAHRPWAPQRKVCRPALARPGKSAVRAHARQQTTLVSMHFSKQLDTILQAREGENAAVTRRRRHTAVGPHS